MLISYEMDEDAGVFSRLNAGIHRIDHLADADAGLISGVQTSYVEADVAHLASPRMITGRSHWISTTQPSFVHTECSVPTGLRITLPSA